MSTIEDLTCDLLARCLSWCDSHATAAAAACASRRLRAAASHDSVWCSLHKQRWRSDDSGRSQSCASVMGAAAAWLPAGSTGQRLRQRLGGGGRSWQEVYRLSLGTEAGVAAEGCSCAAAWHQDAQLRHLSLGA
jgi:hypothetical protein